MTLNKEASQGETSSDLSLLKDKLLFPLRDKVFSVDPAKIAIKRVFQGTKEYKDAIDIVNYSYNSFYGNNGEVVDVARDSLDGLNTTINLAATQEFNGQSIVLTTLRFVHGSNLDVFELFEMEGEKKWPHEQGISNKKPGEIGKFSFHPIFEKKNPKYFSEEKTNIKKVITRNLYENGMKQMKEAGVEIPYSIFTKHVLNFIESTGISPFLKVENAKQKQSESTDLVRKKFSKYWNPDKIGEYQPELFIAPWVLRPVRK